MSTAPTKNLTSADDVCRRAQPSDDGMALSSPGLSARDFLVRLLDKGLYADALKVAAHVLPQREAVWWGVLCAWHAGRPAPLGNVDAALRSVVTWLGDPSEPNRRAAQAAGEAATTRCPAGAIALAAFYCEGSMSYPGLPDVPPPPLLAQNTVAGAVLLAASLAPPEQFADLCRHFVNIAFEVIQGQHSWK